MNTHELKKLVNKKWHRWYENQEMIDNLIENRFVTIELISFLKQTVIPLLNKVYPDRWDIQLHSIINTIVKLRLRTQSVKSHSPMFCYTPKIIIHFPKVEVTDDQTPFSHPMRDIYFAFSLVQTNPESPISIVSVTGIRSSYSYLEDAGKYRFSHLSSSHERDSYTKYCLGTSALQQAVMTFSSDNNPVWFEMLLLQIPFYLSWESREGGPYKYYRELYKKKSTRDVSLLVQISLFNKFLALDAEVLKRLKIVFSGETFKMVLNEEFENITLALCEEEDNLYGYFDETGVEYDFNRVNFEPSPTSETVLFKGQEVPITFYKDELTNFKKILNPKIYEHLHKRVQQHLKETTAKNLVYQEYAKNLVYQEYTSTDLYDY